MQYNPPDDIFRELYYEIFGLKVRDALALPITAGGFSMARDAAKALYGEAFVLAPLRTVAGLAAAVELYAGGSTTSMVAGWLESSPDYAISCDYAAVCTAITPQGTLTLR